MEGPRPELACIAQGRRERSHESNEARACLHFEQFPTPCNDRDWKGGPYGRAMARASARAENLSRLRKYMRLAKACMKDPTPES